MKFKVLIVICLTAFGQSVLASASLDRVNRALKGLDNLSADFKQTVISDQQKVVQQAKGTVDIQRPGKFSWWYQQPYQQQIVADGEELWVYDVDLEQVTVKPMKSALASAPIMVLMSQQRLEKEFTLEDIGKRKILYWVKLLPKNSDMEYSEVYIGLQEDEIKAMELRDSFGQRTQIWFENIRQNVIHNPATFKFVPPAGVDVFGMGG